MVKGKIHRWEWTLKYEHAKSIALEWAQASVTQRDTNIITIDHVNFAYRQYIDILDILNGVRPMNRAYIIAVEDGVVTSESEWRSKRIKHLDPINTAAHPTHRHADWIQTIHRIPEYQAVIRSAPEPKSCVMAFRLAGIDVSLSGYKITPALARYCWDWVNCKPRL